MLTMAAMARMLTMAATVTTVTIAAMVSIITAMTILVSIMVTGDDAVKDAVTWRAMVCCP